jgi:hypothetical protein
MKPDDDPFVPLAALALADELDLLRRPTAHGAAAAPMLPGVPVIGRLEGFDITEQPLVSRLAACPGEVVPARATVALRRAQIGRELLVVFVDGDPHAPVVIGVLEARPLRADDEPPRLPAAVTVDGDRQLIEADREVVLRCGDASITLTRAGKVIIKGSYILSRSTGYNRIKGAAIDLN